jgi:hypothetical protein
LSTVKWPADRLGWQELLAQLTAQPSALADFLSIDTAVELRPGAPIVHVFVRVAHDDAYDAARARIVALAPPTTQLVHTEPLFPRMSSDGELSMAAVAPLASVVGSDHLLHATATLPFYSEDFALYQKRVRGAMFWLGVAIPSTASTDSRTLPIFKRTSAPSPSGRARWRR